MGIASTYLYFGYFTCILHISNVFHADNVRSSWRFNMDRNCYRYRNIEPFKL